MSTHSQVSRRSVLGATAGTAGAAALAGLAGPVGTARAAYPSFQVVSYNHRAASSTEVEFKGDLTRLADEGADIIGLNENMGEARVRASEWASARPRWSFFRPVSAEGETLFKGSNAVLFRNDVFDRLDSGAVFGCHDYTQYEIPERWITWITLRHNGTGRVVTWFQTHMQPGVSNDGHPTDGTRKIEENLKYMNRLKALMADKAGLGDALVGGDWNVCAQDDRRVQYSKFPWTALEERDNPDLLPGVRTTYSYYGFGVQPTGGAKYIDYIGLWLRAAVGNRTIVPASHSVPSGFHSDHRPIRATFTIRTDRF